MYPTHYWIQNPFGIRGIGIAWVPFGEGTLFETTTSKGSNGLLCSESQSKNSKLSGCHNLVEVHPIYLEKWEQGQ